MQRLATTMARSDAHEAYKVVLESHTARALSAKPLLFVYDMVTCDAPFGCLKFCLDAARPPLKDRPDFEKAYGLSRHLQFEMRKKRTSVRMNIFEKVY